LRAGQKPFVSSPWQVLDYISQNPLMLWVPTWLKFWPMECKRKQGPVFQTQPVTFSWTDLPGEDRTMR
jgi:hypothetical protein